MADFQNFEFFQYTNFRELLKFYIQWRRDQKMVFSYRWFSERAGYRSPNFLKLVIDGQRNLTPDGVERVSQVFKWTKAQRKYFRNLVLIEQTQSHEEKEALAFEISRQRAAKLTDLLPEQLAYYTNWHHIAVRELILASPKAMTFKEMGQRLCPQVSEAQVKDAVENLLKLGLIKKQRKWYKVTDQSVDSGDDIQSVALKSYQRACIRLGYEALDRFPYFLREVSSSTLTLTPEAAQRAKVMIQDFKRRLFALEEESAGDKEVIQFNFQMFPLTQKKELP